MGQLCIALLTSRGYGKIDRESSRAAASAGAEKKG